MCFQLGQLCSLHFRSQNAVRICVRREKKRKNVEKTEKMLKNCGLNVENRICLFYGNFFHAKTFIDD